MGDAEPGPVFAGAPPGALTRRGLLAAGGAAAATIALTPATRLATRVAELGVPVHLRRSSYVPLVGHRFDVTAGTRRRTARLVAVENLGTRGRRSALIGREDAFALVFHDPGAARLDQAVMTLRHPVLGRFDLLVSPSSTGRDGHYYSAVINRAPTPGR